jgi:hypothetical protein
MADSVEEQKPTEPQQEEKPVEALVTSKTMRTAKGFRTMQIDPKTHKFVKQPKKMPETREVTRLWREALNKKIQADANGNLTKSSKTRLEQIFERMVAIATNDSADPKWGQNAIAAAEFIMTRAHGKAAPGDAELGALERAGVRVVVLTDPSLSHPEVEAYEDRLHSKPEKPSFADAPFIEGEVVDVYPPPEDDKK